MRAVSARGRLVFFVIRFWCGKTNVGDTALLGLPNVFSNFAPQNARKRMPEKLVAKNRKASYLYEFVDTYTAGMVLTGTEIKSLRQGHASLVDAYCLFINGELWVRNLHIPEYTLGTFYNHAVRRDRKLLLTARELTKLERAVKAKGSTIIATRLFINERGYAKLAIALARGKQQHDKRESLKKRDTDREIQRYRRHSS